MKSPEWEAKKNQRIEIDNSCVMCGRPLDKIRSVQVHHITYARLGNEDVYTDLCTLCGSCHKKIHNYYNRIRKP
jgi:5-methylcytosine-specific restriction endonuclease McrA